jgi:translation initiation factor eIF-2B subunit delta
MPASDSAPLTGSSTTVPKAPSPTIEPIKLTGAELKKQKQAEKAARRAQTVIGKAAIPAVAAPPPSNGVRPEVPVSARGQQRSRANNASSASQQDVAIRSKKSSDEPKEEDKTVEFFRHITKTKAQPAGLKSANKDVHPAVQVLGLQMSNYMICGSSARLVATLQAFKKARQMCVCKRDASNEISGHSIIYHTSREHFNTPFHITCPLTTNRVPILMSAFINIHGQCDPVAET